MLAEFEIVCAISLAASIFLRVINAALLAIAWPISWALLASPWYPDQKNSLQTKDGRLYDSNTNLSTLPFSQSLTTSGYKCNACKLWMHDELLEICFSPFPPRRRVGI